MGMPMSSSPEEFREFADECITWAKAAQLEQERALFLQMARTLIEAAAATSSSSIKKRRSQEAY
jgi:ribosomal protein L17